MSNFDSTYEIVEIEKINLDMDNPRISRIIEMYGHDVSSEAISMALGAGGENSGTTYNSLRESIKTNGGVIHPIILNKVNSDNYIAIEGNTRVQIYRELKSAGAVGNWNEIRAIVYHDLSEDKIHAIRLQSHLVGPREWDPYSKAKYLNHLSNGEKLTINQIIDYCGGNKNEVLKMIRAYQDMEQYYRPLLDDDTEFDARKFSAFVELQNKRITDALLYNRFTKSDFSKWIIDGNIDTMQGVRLIPSILENQKAKSIFLKSNINEARVALDAPNFDEILLKNANINELTNEFIKKLISMPYDTLKRMKKDEEDYVEKKTLLLEALQELTDICDFFSED
jgi:hypothetical protein